MQDNGEEERKILLSDHKSCKKYSPAKGGCVRGSEDTKFPSGQNWEEPALGRDGGNIWHDWHGRELCR